VCVWLCSCVLKNSRVIVVKCAHTHIDTHTHTHTHTRNTLSQYRPMHSRNSLICSLSPPMSLYVTVPGSLLIINDKCCLLMRIAWQVCFPCKHAFSKQQHTLAHTQYEPVDHVKHHGIHFTRQVAHDCERRHVKRNTRAC
jgi:hypothetical protein